MTLVSIKAWASHICWGLPKNGGTGYGNGVPRTDENGRRLKSLLGYLLDGEVDAKEIYDALGVSSSTYYRRLKDDDYPNAEELRRIADKFNLNYPDMQIRFGLMSHDEVTNYLQSAPFRVATVTEAASAVRRPRLSELTPRGDTPPL
jgi:hypothetical protein